MPVVLAQAAVADPADQSQIKCWRSASSAVDLLRGEIKQIDSRTRVAPRLASFDAIENDFRLRRIHGPKWARMKEGGRASG
jgi:hypothetical protein